MTAATSGPFKKFSVVSHDMKFVFAILFMIISISQSKSSGYTMLRSYSTSGNACKWRFFGKSYSNTRSTTRSSFKKRAFSNDDSDFRALQKNFVASHDIKFVFASFFMIISIS